MFRKLSSNALWIWLAPLVGIPLLLAVPLLLNGEVLVYRDLASFIIPAQSYGASILAQGKLPLWNPLLHGGVPFFAEPGTGVLYPPNVVFLLFPAHIAATLFVLLHLPVAAGGATLLVRSLGLSRGAGLLAAFGYGTSGYLISMHGGQYYLASAALLPLVVALLVRVTDVPTGPRVAAAAVGLGLMGLNGEPQGLLLAAGVGTLLGVFRAPRRANYLALLLSLALGAMLGAVQLVPSWFFAQWTSRGVTLPFEEASYWSMHPLRLIEFLVSAPFGRSHPINTFWAWELVPHVSRRWPWAQNYLGPMIAGSALLISLKGTSARLKVMAVLLPLSLLIAAGCFTPVFEYWHRLVPLVGRFRYPEKYAVVSALALVVLAAAALDQARHNRLKFVFGFSALAIVLATIAAALAYFPPEFLLDAIKRGLEDPMARALRVEDCTRTAATAFAKSAALSAVLAGVYWLGGVRPKALLPLLILVAAVDGAGNAMATLTYGSAEPLSQPPPTIGGARELFPAGSTRRIARDPTCELGTFTTLIKDSKNVSVSPQEQAVLQAWLRAQSNRPQYWGVAETQGYSPMFDPLKYELRSRLRSLQAVQRVEGASALYAAKT